MANCEKYQEHTPDSLWVNLIQKYNPRLLLADLTSVEKGGVIGGMVGFGVGLAVQFLIRENPVIMIPFIASISSAGVTIGMGISARRDLNKYK